MEKLSTKERIVKEALILFAERGYGAVSVAEIAEAVGIKAPSLYKHYKSKQDIFDTILAQMEHRYKIHMGLEQIDGEDATADANAFEYITDEQLVQMGKNLFSFFLHDEYTCHFRRMLIIERYHNSELAELYSRQYADNPLSYQGMLFGLLMQAGILRQRDSYITALHFYAPIYLLLSICDCHPEREVESLVVLEQHIRQFNILYRTEGEAEYD